MHSTNIQFIFWKLINGQKVVHFQIGPAMEDDPYFAMYSSGTRKTYCGKRLERGI